MPVPEAATAAVATRTDLPESPSLSILLNGPDSFAGRKLGVLVTEGSDKAVVRAVASAFEDAGAVVEYVAPAIGPVKLKGGGSITPDHAIDGGPSILFDAVALLPSAEGAADLAGRASAQDFVSDAFAHHKFIGQGADAAALLAAAGVEPDEGFADLASADDAAGFVTLCALAAPLGAGRACLRRRPSCSATCRAATAPGWSTLAERARAAAGDVTAALALAAELGDELPAPGAGRTLHLWSALATVAAVDLTVARVLEPHLDALAILSQAARAGRVRDVGSLRGRRAGRAAAGDGRRFDVRAERAQALVLARRPARSGADQRAGGGRTPALRRRPARAGVTPGERHLGGSRPGRGRLRTGRLRGRPGHAGRRSGVVPRPPGLRVGRSRGRRDLVRRSRRCGEATAGGAATREPDQIATMHLGAVDASLHAARCALARGCGCDRRRRGSTVPTAPSPRCGCDRWSRWPPRTCCVVRPTAWARDRSRPTRTTRAASSTSSSTCASGTRSATRPPSGARSWRSASRAVVTDFPHDRPGTSASRRGRPSWPITPSPP